MRRLLLAVAALLLLTAAQVPNHPVLVQDGYFEVGSYRQMPEGMRSLYVAGVIDGLFTSTLLGASETATKALKSCLLRVDTYQLAAIVDKYIKDHPEEWHHGAQMMVYQAMRQFCPSMIPG